MLNKNGGIIMYNLLKEVYVAGSRKDCLNTSKSPNGLAEALISNQAGRVSSLSGNSAPIIRVRLEEDVDINKLLLTGIKQVSFDDDATMGIIVNDIRRMLYKMVRREEIELEEDGITLGKKYFEKVRKTRTRNEKDKNHFENEEDSFRHLDSTFETWLKLNPEYNKARRRAMIFKQLISANGIGYLNYITELKMNSMCEDAVEDRNVYIETAKQWALDEGYESLKDYLDSIIEEMKNSRENDSEFEERLYKDLALNSMYKTFRQKVRRNGQAIAEITVYADKFGLSWESIEYDRGIGNIINVRIPGWRPTRAVRGWEDPTGTYHKNTDLLYPKIEKIYNRGIFFKDQYRWGDAMNSICCYVKEQDPVREEIRLKMIDSISDDIKQRMDGLNW